MLARYEYDVFGAIRSETGTSDNTRKFTGKEFDADSNLYYCAARYYDPYIGRFTQRDPAGDGVNWYAYTYNNPLKFVDPTGLAPKRRAPKWFEKFLAEVLAMFGLPDPYSPFPPEGDPLPGTGDTGVGLHMGPNAATVFRLLISTIIFEEMVGLVWDFVSPSEVATEQKFYDKIQEEGGYGELGDPGDGQDVRHIDNSGQDHAEAFFWRLAGEEADERPAGGAGTILIGKDPAGNTITYRKVSKGYSKTSGYDGPPTVTIFENGKETKLKFKK